MDSITQNSKSAMAMVEVRKRFVDYAERNPDKVHERDLERLKTDDWYLKRYVLARNRQVKETLDMLKRTMEWRNEFGIHLSEDHMFPQEFYKIGALFPYENDKKGNLVLYMRIKYHRKITEMVEVEKHFLVHTFEKIDRITNGNGLVIVFDCNEAGYANCDVEFLQFLISCATEHAPVGLQYIIVYKLPWILNAFWSLARKLLPVYLANRVRFCDEKSVRDFIDPDNLPDFMGGNCRRNYRWVPPGSPSVFKLAHAYGISDQDIQTILPQFQAFLDEADEALQNNTYIDPPEAIVKYMNNPEVAKDMCADLVLGIQDGGASSDQQKESSTIERMSNRLANLIPVDSSMVRVFPNQFVELIYDAFDNLYYATLTIYNPSAGNTLAFRVKSNRQTAYSVKPARGLIPPSASITLNIALLGEEHDIQDKFLIIAQSVRGQVDKMSLSEFESLWQSDTESAQTSIKLGSYIKGPRAHRQRSSGGDLLMSPERRQVQKLLSTCRSLKRGQSLSILINVILLLIIISLLYLR